ncbi:DUF4097 domain-containing protein [Adhaeribacter pallidiroseus]|uniref:DUF4097 domain-containing protein n=1 Tax=Adhaeribacter pallidiroseus TaxID=2072847 RepID=A0A369QL98_9BACT|nr:DUF4097 domain-containing protein [Adhaeribacter pallidiroseus]RDC65494.1 hypothetical protein AHMF7616_04124 [Adhaeribacter pallidiroseus]
MKKTGILAALGIIIITTGGVVAHRHEEQLPGNNRAATQLFEKIPVDETPDGKNQTYKIKLDNNKNNQVQIEVYRSSVAIVGHNADEVIIEAPDYEVPERAEGLRSLFSEAEDNTKLGLSVNKDNNILKIVQANRRGGHYTIKVPKNVAVVYHESSPFGGKFELTDTAGEIDLELHHAGATLTNITGPVNANTVHGHLDIKFAELNQAKSSSIKSVHGPIDITLPGNTKADLELEANHGEIYTDFDISRPSNSKNGLPQIAGGGTIKGKTNNGGVEMNVSAVHSNIYIRKQK